MKEDLHLLHLRCIKTLNKLFSRAEEDPLFKEAYFMLEDLDRYIQTLTLICGCPKCREQYWCKDVGEFCPNCGVEVLKYTNLNWDIWSPVAVEGWKDEVDKAYRRRGDLPLKPKKDR